MRFPLSLACLALPALAIAGCGSPASIIEGRELQSITISPATAGGSTVQFTATGHWSQSPVTVTPQSATWGACTTGNVPTTDVTVSSSGVASCTSAAKGAYNVYAWDPQYGFTGPECNAITACGTGCGRVSATVQLTCP